MNHFTNACISGDLAHLSILKQNNTALYYSLETRHNRYSYLRHAHENVLHFLITWEIDDGTLLDDITAYAVQFNYPTLFAECLKLGSLVWKKCLFMCVYFPEIWKVLLDSGVNFDVNDDLYAVFNFNNEQIQKQIISRVEDLSKFKFRRPIHCNYIFTERQGRCILMLLWTKLPIDLIRCLNNFLIHK